MKIQGHPGSDPSAAGDAHKSAPSRSQTSRPIMIGINILAVLLLAAALVLAWLRFTGQQAWLLERTSSTSAGQTPVGTQFVGATLSPLQADVSLPEFALSLMPGEGIARRPDFQTIIPTRPRVNVITYTVQRGDNLFSIADSFNLKAETLLWGNFETLNDNPHLLKPDQVLNILPVNGTYYQWQAGDNLNAVADFFKIDSKAILEFSGNHLDLTAVTSQTVGIAPGTWLIVPGGKRAIKDWGPPAISRKNPASARYYGDGYCGAVYEGAIGTGGFIWPTPSHSISGYTYGGIHPAIDLAGGEGSPVVAADSGVIVYAGWSNYGYGYLIVIDHGNGFQTAYAHLSAIAVGCGQSVFMSSYIGAIGNTGNSYGAHLHFEIVYGGLKVNPLDYLP